MSGRLDGGGVFRGGGDAIGEQGGCRWVEERVKGGRGRMRKGERNGMKWGEVYNIGREKACISGEQVALMSSGVHYSMLTTSEDRRTTPQAEQ